MTQPDGKSDTQTSAADPAAITQESGRRKLLAPWWHTLLMIVLILGLSATGAVRMRHIGHHPLHLIPNYLLTTLYEWVLAGIVLWGIHLRGVPRQQLVGEWRPGVRGWLSDFAFALLFWVVALMLLSFFAQAMRFGFGSNVDAHRIADVTRKLGPTTGIEMVLFLVLSFSAGICEEFVFRGYFQQQFARAGRNIWIGVLLSALVFGCAHGYEGLAGVLLIAAYGAMFSVLALFRRGLRTGMMAHAWHDSISGITLLLLRHYGFHLGAK